MLKTEQGDGINFCCSLPNQCCDSYTARLAAVEALYFAKTGTSLLGAAFRSLNWYLTSRDFRASLPVPYLKSYGSSLMNSQTVRDA